MLLTMRKKPVLELRAGTAGGLIGALRTLKCQRELYGMAILYTITRKQQGVEVKRKEGKHGLHLGIIINRLLKRKAHLDMKL